MAHEAEMPKTAFSGTAMTATSSVSRMAASASGSLMAARANARPFSDACKKTVANGRSRNSPMKPMAMVHRTTRISGWSCVALRWCLNLLIGAT
jgi:hypothetical protein